jgi:hypothetical protein
MALLLSEHQLPLLRTCSAHQGNRPEFARIRAHATSTLVSVCSSTLAKGCSCPPVDSTLHCKLQICGFWHTSSNFSKNTRKSTAVTRREEKRGAETVTGSVPTFVWFARPAASGSTVAHTPALVRGASPICRAGGEHRRSAVLLMCWVVCSFDTVSSRPIYVLGGNVLSSIFYILSIFYLLSSIFHLQSSIFLNNSFNFFFLSPLIVFF